MKPFVPSAAALALLLLGAADAAEYTLSSAALPTSADAELVFGTFPPRVNVGTIPPVTLDNFVTVAVTANCQSLTPVANLAGKTIVIGDVPSNCLGQGDKLLNLLAGASPGPVKAIIGLSGTNVISSIWPNYALKPQSSTPASLQTRWNDDGTTNSWIFVTDRAWAKQLANQIDAGTVSTTDTVTATVKGVDLNMGTASPNVAVVQGHMSYFYFTHPNWQAGADTVQVTVTPLYGNPNLYINTGASKNLLMLPGKGISVPSGVVIAAPGYSATSPGDDALTIPITPAAPSLAIGVYGELPSEFSVLVSSASTTTLTSGLPVRYVLGNNEEKYFVIPVLPNQPLELIVTSLTSATPYVYVTSDQTDTKPTADSAMAIINATQVYQHLSMPVGDPARSGCPTSGSCNIHITVKALGATTFSIVGVAGENVPIRLIDGVPQNGYIGGASGGSAQYTVKSASSAASITMRLVSHCATGAASFVAYDHQTDLPQWSSVPASTGDEILTISPGDPGFAVFVDFPVTVTTTEACPYTITATSSSAIQIISDGVPAGGAVSAGSYEYFKFYISLPSADVQIVLNGLSGDPDLFVSFTNHKPNATAGTGHDFYSQSHVSSGEVITMSHTEPKLQTCTSQSANPCVIYIAVYGSTNSQFSITATATDLTDGFHIDLPPTIAGGYPYTVSLFGPRLPSTGSITACLEYVNPADACVTLTNDLTGKVALVDRGSTAPYGSPGYCQYPEVYFANKVLKAQQAGALAVVINNNIANAGLVNMIAVSNDASSSVTIPSLFVTKETGDILKGQMSNASVDCVQTSLKAQAGRLPMLVNGISTLGVLSAPDSTGTSIRYYGFLAPSGKDNVSISVTADFGNPDLIVSADGQYPSQTHYTWAARDFGADTLTINGHDPQACQACLYYVGVLATGGDVFYTITASIAETMRTLQPATPLEALEVSAGQYQYFRLFIDSTTAQYGITFSVTTVTGVVEIFASFATEKPSSTDHQYSSPPCPPSHAYCGPSTAHGAALHVPPGYPSPYPNTPHHCHNNGFNNAFPCMLYVAVKGVVASRFSLLATIQSNDATPVALIDGSVQRIGLPSEGSYAYFTFYVDVTVEKFVIDVLKLQGDPDLYVNGNATDTAFPSTGSYDAKSNTLAGESLTVVPDTMGLCKGCSYRIAVYAYDLNTEFLISATTRVGVRLLGDGLPASGSAGQGEVRYFRYFVRTLTDIDLVLTPLGGNPSLFARFGCRPLYQSAFCNATGGGAGSFDSVWSSEQDEGVEQIHLNASDPGFCTPPCTLYVAVRGETSTSFSLLITQAAQSLITLVDGQPQSGSVGAGEYKYYVITTPMAEGVTVSLTGYVGSPIFYYTRTNSLPTQQLHEGDVVNTPLTPLFLNPITASPPAVQTIIIGVAGLGNAAADFSLVAHSGGAAALLVEGVPTLGKILPFGLRALYSIDVPWNAAEPQVIVTSLQGSVRVLVSHSNAFPTDDDDGVPGVYDHAVTAVAGEPTPLALTANTFNTIAVKAPAGTGSSCGHFTILGLVNPGAQPNVVQLFDGAPQNVPVPGADCAGHTDCPPGSAARLRFIAHAGMPVSISASITEFSVLRAIEENGGTLPKLTLHVAKASVTNKPDECGQAGLCFHHVSSYPGSASFALTPAELSCSENCVIYVALEATTTCNVTVTATIGLDNSAGVLLPLNLQTCTSVTTGQLVKYTALLDPSASPTGAVDDDLAVDMYTCAGGATLMASANPFDDLAPYQSTNPYEDVVEFTGGQLSGKCEAYAAASATTSATDESNAARVCLEARPKSRARRETILEGAAGAVTVSGEATFQFTMIDPSNAAYAEGDCSFIVYQLWASPKTAVNDGHNMQSWCGIVDADDSKMVYEIDAESLGSGTTSLTVPDADLNSVMGDDMFGIEHRFTIVAIVTPICTPTPGAVPIPVRHILYQTDIWTPVAIEEGGMNIMVILLIVLTVLVCGCVGVVAYKCPEKLPSLRRDGKLLGRGGARTMGGGGYPDFSAGASTFGSPLPGEAPNAALRLSQESPASLEPITPAVVPLAGVSTETPGVPSSSSSSAPALGGRSSTDAKYKSRMARARNARRSAGGGGGGGGGLAAQEDAISSTAGATAIELEAHSLGNDAL